MPGGTTCTGPASSTQILRGPAASRRGRRTWVASGDGSDLRFLRGRRVRTSRIVDRNALGPDLIRRGDPDRPGRAALRAPPGNPGRGSLTWPMTAPWIG